jgi:hypothetical protein
MTDAKHTCNKTSVATSSGVEQQAAITWSLWWSKAEKSSPTAASRPAAAAAWRPHLIFSAVSSSVAAARRRRPSGEPGWRSGGPSILRRRRARTRRGLEEPRRPGWGCEGRPLGGGAAPGQGGGWRNASSCFFIVSVSLARCSWNSSGRRQAISTLQWSLVPSTKCWAHAKFGRRAGSVCLPRVDRLAQDSAICSIARQGSGDAS